MRDQGWAELRWDGTPKVSVPSWSLWMQPGGPIEAADMTRLVWGAVGGMVRRRMKSVSGIPQRWGWISACGRQISHRFLIGDNRWLVCSLSEIRTGLGEGRKRHGKAEMARKDCPRTGGPL